LSLALALSPSLSSSLSPSLSLSLSLFPSLSLALALVPAAEGHRPQRRRTEGAALRRPTPHHSVSCGIVLLQRMMAFLPCHSRSAARGWAEWCVGGRGGGRRD